MTEQMQVLWRQVLGFRRTDHPAPSEVRAAARRAMLANVGLKPTTRLTQREIRAACSRKHLGRSRSVGPATALVWALTELGQETKRKGVA